MCMWSVLLNSMCAVMMTGNGGLHTMGSGSEMFVWGLKVLCAKVAQCIDACRQIMAAMCDNAAVDHTDAHTDTWIA